MKITDKEAIKELKKINDCELYENIESYPENERDGRSDMQMIADELGYIVSCFEEEGHVFQESLEHAKEVLKETKSGKVIPMYKDTLNPVYRQSDIDIAKDCVKQYKHLRNAMKRIQSKGYYSKWLII